MSYRLYQKLSPINECSSTEKSWAITRLKILNIVFDKAQAENSEWSTEDEIERNFLINWMNNELPDL